MKALLLVAASVTSAPSDEDISRMFDRPDAFVRVCAPPFELIEPSEEQQVAGAACAAFVTGLAHARAAASTYEMNGQPVCAMPASAREVVLGAISMYRSTEEARHLAPAELLTLAHMRAKPCR